MLVLLLFSAAARLPHTFEVLPAEWVDDGLSSVIGAVRRAALANPFIRFFAFKVLPGVFEGPWVTLEGREGPGVGDEGSSAVVVGPGICVGRLLRELDIPGGGRDL